MNIHSQGSESPGLIMNEDVKMYLQDGGSCSSEWWYRKNQKLDLRKKWCNITNEWCGSPGQSSLMSGLSQIGGKKRPRKERPTTPFGWNIGSFTKD